MVRYKAGRINWYMYKPAIRLNDEILDQTILQSGSSWREKLQYSNNSNKKKIFVNTEQKSKASSTNPVNLRQHKLNIDDIKSPVQNTHISAITHTKISLLNTKLHRKKWKFHKKLFRQERLNRKMYQLSKIKKMTITCPELSNVTFTNSPPFNVLGIPQCADKVNPKFR